MGCANTTSAGGATPDHENIANDIDDNSAEGLAVWSQDYFHDEYVLSQKLGSGAFASVFSARRASEGDEDVELAVKITDLRANRGSSSFTGAVDQKRYMQVAQEVAYLQRLGGCTQVITLHEAFMEGGIAYLVMEKCRCSLLHALESLPAMTETTLRGPLSGMLSALAAVHEAEVVHCDVKPDNFLCTGPDMDVRLCDFGLSRLVPSGRRPSSSSGRSSSSNKGLQGIYGTVPFMAPEMLRLECYGTQVDCWSLGVIGYVLFFGRFPYRGANSSGAEMKAAIRAGRPAPSFEPAEGLLVGEDRACISDRGRALLRELLCRKPSDRLTAKESLQHPFFKQAVDPSNEASLLPMLSAARRIGAFDIRAEASEPTSLEARLITLQEKKHGPEAPSRLLEPISPKAPTSEWSTAPGSSYCSAEIAAASAGTWRPS